MQDTANPAKSGSAVATRASVLRLSF